MNGICQVSSGEEELANALYRICLQPGYRMDCLLVRGIFRGYIIPDIALAPNPWL